MKLEKKIAKLTAAKCILFPNNCGRAHLQASLEEQLNWAANWLVSDGRMTRDIASNLKPWGDRIDDVCPARVYFYLKLNEPNGGVLGVDFYCDDISFGLGKVLIAKLSLHGEHWKVSYPKMGTVFIMRLKKKEANFQRKDQRGMAGRNRQMKFERDLQGFRKQCKANEARLAGQG